MLKSMIGGIVLACCAAGPGHAGAPDAPLHKKTLTAFASDAQLAAVLKDYAEHLRRQALTAGAEHFAVSPPPPAPSPATASARSSPESVTNNQSAGVDEGGIVKVHGKHLVMLRRGRLFTVDIDGRQLKNRVAVDAFAPGADPSGSWYDEMLISGDTVVVIGYSYQRGGTEIGLFDIDGDGALAYRATYHLRSNDYYSSSDYASRLVGNKLVFYSPLYLHPSASDPFAGFPALRKWRPGATPDDFKRIAPARRIYRSPEAPDYQGALALHTVTVCDLGRAEMSCSASAVLGPPGRIFYASAEAVYVWTSPRNAWRDSSAVSGLVRMPLDGSAPTALKVSGAPVDQFSFLEGADRHLNVLVRASGNGEATGGSAGLALLRVPLGLFGDGNDMAPRQRYLALPGAGSGSLHNRFIGNYLLYGSSAGWRDAQGAAETLYAQRLGGGAAAQIRLAHGVDRIEAMGDDAVVAGAGGADLHFSSISLAGEPSLAHRYVRARAAQGESRSHGFFYKPDGATTGFVGLPIRQRGDRAAVLYLRNDGLRLTELGALSSKTVARQRDNCKASCVDWYGNARPLFLRGRVFALMGYELVEGRLGRAGIAETRRISFAP